MKWAIDNNISGLYHVTNNLSISKFDLLKLINKHADSNIEIIPSDTVKVDKSFIDTRQEINFRIPSYDEMVFNMMQHIKTKQHLYNHYSN